jgi:hypothetical protein
MRAIIDQLCSMIDFQAAGKPPRRAIGGLQ